ncbi:hypothetical protein F5884DRAFT_368690 [Xylogone sp. PMI_703]|nr:hypothetical protein F5884DRAFT_368690 [Xylogone sp. PMI_703]
MATATEARAPLVTNSTSSFGQFRITKFVQSDLQPHTAPINQEAGRRPPGADRRESSENLNRDSMFPTPRASSYRQLEDGPSAAPSIAPQEQSVPALSTNGSSATGLDESVEDITESPSNLVLTRQLGPNRDGRVRNPVPSKLKGKTDTKKGNFGVMHMGLALSKKNESPARDTAAERGAAAQRTSEGTVSRAKAAQQDKYIPPRKRATTAAVDDISPKMTSGGSQFGRVGPPDYHKPRGRALAPDEVKQEQARLLTLLRSIAPLTVVDQLCKAVAYFGGIPSAPPPEDGIFPESANTRESGALFVGWLAEIFPNVTNGSEVSRIPEQVRTPEVARNSVAPQLPEPSRPELNGRVETPVLPPASKVTEPPKVQEPQPPQKRGRGRPRKNAQPPAAGPPAAQGTPDVSSSARSNGEPYRPSGTTITPPTWDIPRATTSAPSQNLDMMLEATAAGDINSGLQKSTEVQAQSTPVGTNKQPESDSANVTMSVKKGRGRPKGSKNKNKNVAAGPEDTPTAPNAHQSTSTTDQTLQPPQPPVQMLQTTHSQVSLPQHSQPQAAMIDSAHKSSHPVIDPTSTSDQSQSNYPKPLWENETWGKRMTPSVGTTQMEDLSAAERAVLEAFRGQKSTQTFNATGLNQAAAITTQAAGVKRKRPSASMQQLDTPNLLGTSVAEQPQITATAATANNASLSQDVQNILHQSQNPLQWNPSGSSTLGVQPIKRQRKPKPPSQNAPAPTQPTHVSDISPSTSQSTLPDSVGSASNQAVPVSQPSIGGLDAQYERFASLQQQNEQNRNRTPTISQQQPQLPQRSQHQMAASPPKQTPQHQGQRPSQQIQRQIQQVQRQPHEVPKATAVAQHLPQQTQQSDKQDSQQMAKNSSTRTPSNFYSNQGLGYSQQYPSNTSSQQYSPQQASPPITNSSFGGSRTHSLAGSSSQFPQSESVYRTNSPHSLPQTSSAFSQAESYKANHSSLSNTSSYPQVNNNYRVTNMHNLPQQSAAVFNTRQPQTAITTTQAQATQQNTYTNNTPYDPTFIDLPTLEQLGRSGVGGYGMGAGVGVSRAGTSNTGSYGTTSSLNSSGFDTSMGNLLQAASRPGSNTGYRTSSGIGNNPYRDHHARS